MERCDWTSEEMEYSNQRDSSTKYSLLCFYFEFGDDAGDGVSKYLLSGYERKK